MESRSWRASCTTCAARRSTDDPVNSRSTASSIGSLIHRILVPRRGGHSSGAGRALLGHDGCLRPTGSARARGVTRGLRLLGGFGRRRDGDLLGGALALVVV